MKKARFTETQIVNILKFADSGMPLIIIGNQSMVVLKSMMLND